MKKLNYLIGYFLIAGLVSLQAAAAEEEKDQRVYDLGEIVVTAQGTGVEAIGTVRMVTAEEIEMSGAQTLDDAIRLLPGIMVRTGGQGVARPDLRGMKPRHITLLIDGIPFNSAGDGQFDPTLISTDKIAKIKVSYGNDSVLYGPGGLGGVINVITKKGTKNTELNVSGQYAQDDTWLGWANFGGGTDRINYFVSASDYTSDGYRLSKDFTPTDYEEGETRNNSDRKLRSFFGNLTLTPSDKSKVGLIINKINGEHGVPPITLDRTDPFGKNPKHERVDDQDGLSISLSGGYDFDGPISIRGWAFMNDLDELKNGYDDDTYKTQVARNSYRANETTEIRGANIQPQYLFGNSGKLSLTLGTKEEKFDSSGWEVGRNDISYFDESHEITTNTVAAEYDMQPLNNLGFVAGYGYSWFRKEGGQHENKGNYMVGFNYDFTQISRIRASVAENIRFPSVTQLYGIGEGNPDLIHEESINYELGFEQSVNQIDTAFSITGFRRNVENYIAKDADGVNRNNEEYQFQGIEITARNRSVKNLDLNLAYTYMDAKDKSPGALVEEVQYNPEHKLALQGSYEFAYDITAYSSIERIENQYYYNSDNTLKGKLPDYTIINLRVEKKFFARALKIFTGADNLLDENYFESYALPREGRSIYGGFTYSFK